MLRNFRLSLSLFSSLNSLSLFQMGMEVGNSLSSFRFLLLCFRSTEILENFVCCFGFFFCFFCLFVWPFLCCLFLIEWEVESVEAAVHRPLLGICTESQHKNTNRSINLCIQRSLSLWVSSVWFLRKLRTIWNSETFSIVFFSPSGTPFVFLSGSRK